MSPNFRHSLGILTFSFFVGASSSAIAAPTGGFYETFAGIEIAGLDLSNSYLGIGYHYGNATNVTVGGGKVYWQDGLNIYSANPDLSGVTLFHTNGAVATDIAVDATNGIFYETFAGNEIAALSLANSYLGLGYHFGNATNVTVGGGKVYWQDGLNIYSANPDLSGVTLFHTNGAVATDIAVDASNGVFYETFAGNEIAALSLANSYLGLGYHFGNATNVTVGGGKVYWQDGLNIYSANPNLSGVTLFHTNGAVATDIALLEPTQAVPEPESYAMLLAGLGLMGVVARRRKQAA